MKYYFKKYNNILLQLLWGISSISFILLLLSSGYMAYETNDDLFISFFPSGILGKNYPFTIHTNIVMGYILAVLNSIPLHFKFNITTLYSVFCIIISYLFLGLWLTKKRNFRGFTESVCFLFLTIGIVLHRYNYSKTGSLLLMIGFVLLSLHQKGDSKIWLFIGDLLIILGSLFRYKTTLAVVPFAIISFIYVIYNQMHKKELKYYLMHWFGVLCIILLLWGVDYGIYHFNPEWNYFKQFNDTREHILDYQVPSYEQNKDDYLKIGWSENDYNCFSAWNFSNADSFNPESLKVVKSLIPSRKHSSMRKFLMQVAFQTVDYCMNNLIFQFMLIELIMIAIYTPNQVLFALLPCLTAMGEIAALFFVQRSPERALFIPLICGYLAICLLNKNENHKLVEISLIVYLFVTCSIINLPHHSLELQKKEQNLEFLEYTSASQDKLYVWDVSTISDTTLNTFAPLDPLPNNYLCNSVLLGGWIYPSPVYVHMCDSFGDGYNVFKLLAQNPNVLYISYYEPSELLLTYIREHYNPNAIVKEVSSNGDFHVYSFTE